MKKVTVLCIAGSLWLFTGVLGYAQTIDKGNSGERKTIHKRSHSRFNAPHPRLEGGRIKDSGKELSFEALRMLSTGMSKAEVRQHAYEMFRDKLPERPLTLADWVIAEKDLVNLMEADNLPK